MPKLEELSYLTDTQSMIDAVHSMSDADLVGHRPELIEYLECACDFMAWQSAAIRALEDRNKSLEARLARMLDDLADAALDRLDHLSGANPSVLISDGIVSDGLPDRRDRWWRSSPGYVHRALFVSGLFFGFAGGIVSCYSYL